MSKKIKAIANFKNNYNCSQSVLSAFCEDFNFELEPALRIASGFGGGMGKQQHTCGAITGAYMVIGLRFYDPKNPAESKTKVYGKIQEFTKKFIEKNQTTDCLHLLGADMNTQEGSQYIRENNLFELKCEKLIKDACIILEEMTVK